MTRYAGSLRLNTAPPWWDTRPEPFRRIRLSSGDTRFTRRPPTSLVSVNRSRSGSWPRSERRNPFLPCGDPWHAPELHPARERAAITSRRNETSGSPAAAGAAKTMVSVRITERRDMIYPRGFTLGYVVPALRAEAIGFVHHPGRYPGLGAPTRSG